jgi:hypothetical protein
MMVVERVRSIFGRRDEVIAHCETDDWDFAPRYTGGVCPICGWRAMDADLAPPLFERISWFWPAMITMAVVSVVMAIVVIVTYASA